MNPTEIKDKFDQIIPAIANEIYQEVNSATASISAFIEFDDQQRVKRINNFMVDSALKVPSFELIEKISTLSSEITSFPQEYWIKSLDLRISPGGKLSMTISYLEERDPVAVA